MLLKDVPAGRCTCSPTRWSNFTLSRAFPTKRCAGCYKKRDCCPGCAQEWCIPKVGAECVWRMEELLDLYMQPYDEAFPVVCIDERPCQLIGHLQPPEPAQPGRPAREDTEFSRNGACSTFLMAGTASRMASWPGERNTHHKRRAPIASNTCWTTNMPLLPKCDSCSII